MEKAFLSIIIPTFNSEKVIQQCLDSIHAQTFGNFEVIIHDGGSADSTAEIIKENAAKDKRIKLFIERDQGVYDAMNKAVHKAQGEWIYFLGSDDMFYNNDALQNVSAFISKNNEADIVYGNVYMRGLNAVYDGEFTKEKLLTQNICHQGIFARRKTFETIGYFDIRYKTHADWDHNLRWFLSKKIIKKYINLVVAFYADMGLSSKGDEIFDRDKNFKYILYGRQSFSIGYKVLLLRRELKNTIRQNDIRKALKLLIYSPYLLL